jgi:hypothetical protein
MRCDNGRPLAEERNLRLGELLDLALEAFERSGVG